MTNKVFIPISVEDELPYTSSKYFTDRGLCNYDRHTQAFYTYESFRVKVKTWLKEVELPTEEEIKNQKYIADNGYFFSDHRSFIEGANHILKLLKAK